MSSIRTTTASTPRASATWPGSSTRTVTSACRPGRDWACRSTKRCWRSSPNSRKPIAGPAPACATAPSLITERERHTPCAEFRTRSVRTTLRRPFLTLIEAQQALAQADEVAGAQGHAAGDRLVVDEGARGGAGILQEVL